MFGLGEEVNALLEVVQEWTLNNLNEKIEDAKRELASAKRQKQLVEKILSQYKRSQEKQKKKMAEWQKKQNAAIKKMPRFPS